MTEEETKSTTTPSPLWVQFFTPFAATIGKTMDEVTEALLPLVGEATDEMASALANPSVTDDETIKNVFPGIPAIKRSLAIKNLRESAAPKVAEPAAMGPSNVPSMAAMLPQPPDDESLLEALKVGGTLKVGETEVTAAVRVLLADRLQLEGIERRVADAIEERATSLGEPVPDIFYELESSIGRRHYADVLKAMGMPGNLVSAGRKKDLLGRISGIFNILNGFQTRITGWQEQWMTRISNPSALFAGFAAMMGGGGANPATATLMEAPDTGPVLDAAAGVIDKLNAMFAGTGIPVARALAGDAIATRRFLENANLVAAVGAGSRDEMLKTLGIAVSADLVRAERDVTQYILGVMRVQKLTTQQLPAYIVALQQLGAQLPWGELLGGNASAGNGSRYRRDPHPVTSGRRGNESPDDVR